MIKKIIISVVIITLVYFLINKYYIENMWCKSENGHYEIWGKTPVDITEKIKKQECECISDGLIIESKPALFNKTQLEEIKKQLPVWVFNNIKGFSEKDKAELSLQLKGFTDQEFLQKLEYQYSFIEDTYLTCFVPVYIFKIGSKKAYIPNYKCVYDDYKRLEEDPERVKFLSKQKAPNYPIIESESWARNLGEKGI
ncbi:MAG: hypothetical protein ABI554_15105 [Flavobacterium sp.]